MAQYGGDQYVKEGHQSTGEYGHNPAQSTTVGHEIGGTGTNVQTATHGHGHEQATHGHGHEQAGKHDGGILHRSGSGSSSSSEDDGEGGRRKKGVAEKIKEKLPGGDHGVADEHKAPTTTTAAAAGTGGVGHGYEGGEEAEHEKKGLMEKIKEKLPGGQ